MAIFKGAGVAIVTPMNEDGFVNYEKFGELIEFQIANGTDAIIVCGTTGESSTLTHEEHLDTIKYCVDKVAKRIPVVAGTGSNCTETAVYLSQEAEKYGVDVHRAEVAGLLHDCTKKLSMPEQLALCEKYGIALDELEKKALKLLHAKTGAALARDVFGVDDEIYNAILWHTTGKPDMTVLEKVIYLADFIEPTRDFPGVDALRRTVWEDLDRGLLMGLEMTVEEMEEMGNPIHVNTLAARDYLKGKTNEGKAGSGKQP